MEKQTKTVAFRLAAEQYMELAGRATAAGQSPGEVARDLTLAGLNQDSELHQLRLTVLDLQAEVKKVRVDLAMVAEAVLSTLKTNDGTKLPAAEAASKARAWVDKHIRSH